MSDAADTVQATRLPPDPPSRRPVKPAVWLGLAVVAVCLIGAILIGIYGSRLWGGAPAKPPAVSAAAVREPAVTAEDATATALRSRIAQLEQELAEARRGLAAGVAEGSLDSATARSLAARLDRLEAAQRRSGRAAAAAVAAGALADAAQTSRPFSAELASLERLMPDSAQVAGLRRLADAGAPTRAALAAEFPEAAARAAAAARAPGAKASFLSRALAAVGSLVTIRRIDRTSGTSTDAVLARAEVRAGDGDLEGALDQMRALPPAALAATADWRERAARRIEIERRVAALRAAALRDLAFEAPAPADTQEPDR
jgi:hypothetical protein